MTRGQISIIPEYYKTYTKLIPEDMHLKDALDKYGPSFYMPELAKLQALGDQIYAPGKWNVKQTLVHIIDAERVFAYRALRFARNDNTPLSGFEQDDYVAAAQVQIRSVDSILEELTAVRNSSIQFFGTLSNQELSRSGVASGQPVSVLALGFMACGHLVHHQNLFAERYYPLL